MREIKNAMEQYYTICGMVYPSPVDDYYDPIVCWEPVTQGILENMPADPRTGNPYICPEIASENCNENSYKVCTQLEAEEPAEYCVNSAQ